MIKVDNLRFALVNSGVDVFLRDQEEPVARFNPTESLKVLQFLENHREEFEKAEQLATMPVLGSAEWHNQKLEEAFSNMPE